MKRSPCEAPVMVYMPVEQKRVLEEMAAARQSSVSAVVRLAVVEHLARQPKVYTGPPPHDR